MNKKSSGVQREYLNARGYEQVYGLHYDSANILSLVANDTRNKIVLVSEIMVAWLHRTCRTKILLLHGEFTENENPTYMDIP